ELREERGPSSGGQAAGGADPGDRHVGVVEVAEAALEARRRLGEGQVRAREHRGEGLDRVAQALAVDPELVEGLVLVERRVVPALDGAAGVVDGAPGELGEAAVALR